MPLLDHLGRPISTSALRRDVAVASTMSTRRSVDDATVANGLTAKRLASVLRSADRADNRDLLTLAQEMEERDGHYASVMQTRKLAVWGLKAQVIPASDDARDEDIAETIRQEIVEKDDFVWVVKDALDALGKGYSMLEIDWDMSESQWMPSGFEWKDPRWFVWGADGKTLQLREQGNQGVPLPPWKFIHHRARIRSGPEYRDGLARTCAVLYLFGAFGLRDWMAYGEVFGMPLRVGYYDQTATEEDVETLMDAVAMIGSDAGAVIPESMRIEIMKASAGVAGGAEIFKGLLEWLDKTKSKVVLGQTMTTEDGSSLAQAKVHADVRQDILWADAFAMTGTLRRDLFRPVTELNWGEGTRPPLVLISPVESEDLGGLAESIVPFLDRGLPVPWKWVAEKFGVEGAGEDEELLRPVMAQVPVTEEPPEEQPEDSPADDGDESEAREENRRRAHNRQHADGVERLASEVLESEWEPMMTDLEQRLQKAADESATFTEFRRKLPGVISGASLNLMAERLADVAFRARGMGDATDNVDP